MCTAAAASSVPAAAAASVPGAVATVDLPQAVVSKDKSSAAIGHGIGTAVSSLGGTTASADSPQATISTVGQSVVAIEPGIGSTSTCPLALGVGLVWMEAFRQICFLVPSIHYWT